MEALKRTRLRHWALGLFLAVIAYAGWDLFGPRSSDLRSFASNDVARLETAMWRNYYDRRPLPLFLHLSEQMRSQYHFPWLRSQVAAYHAARAAFVFKGGHARRDYEQALPSLEAFYRMISNVSAQPFDSPRAARLELEWWIVHREVSAHSPQRLSDALAELQACIYRLPANRFSEHARARAQAMLLRDRAGDNGGSVSEQQWGEIHRLLQVSWDSLWRGVHSA